MKVLATQFTHSLAALALMFAGFPLLAQQPLYDRPEDPNVRDLLILTDWFEGEFDNEEQLWFQADPRSKTLDAEKHGRLHTIHRRLDLPDFGEHVFYVEEYKDNDPEDLIRQRFVIFTSEGAGDGIRMQQGFFKEPEQAKGAQFAPEKLADLRANDVFFLNECDVTWLRVADQYQGEMAAKSCVFGEGNKRRYSVHNLVLSADKYWRVDMTRLVADDSIHVGLPEDNPTRLRRANPYVCEMSFRLASGTSQTIEDIQLHSQGGAREVSRSDTGESYTLRLRDKEYPFYNTRPDFLFLSVRKTGEQRSLAYTVGDADARRLGVNFDGVSAHCHRDGYEFRELIQQLGSRISD